LPPAPFERQCGIRRCPPLKRSEDAMSYQIELDVHVIFDPPMDEL
jgi:hypothetical protein